MGQLAIKSNSQLLPLFFSQVLIFPCVSITAGYSMVGGNRPPLPVRAEQQSQVQSFRQQIPVVIIWKG